MRRCAGPLSLLALLSLLVSSWAFSQDVEGALEISARLRARLLALREQAGSLRQRAELFERKSRSLSEQAREIAQRLRDSEERSAKLEISLINRDASLRDLSEQVERLERELASSREELARLSQTLTQFARSSWRQRLGDLAKGLIIGAAIGAIAWEVIR